MRDQIIKELDGLIAKLDQPLSEDELTHGWTPQCQVATLLFLRNVRERVLQGENLPDLSIGRSLDHWGVLSGSLLEEACAVSNRLREFRSC